jgi:uncharacterized membrane protein YfcA
VGLETATPLVALVALTSAVLSLLTAWEHLDVRSAGRLLVGSLAGIPLGLLLLRAAPAYPMKALLGIVVVGFSLLNLTRPQLPRLQSSAPAYLFGFVAGVLGGAYNTNGPPVVLYGALRHWPPRQFRASLQGYFLPTSILICAGHGMAGLWTPAVLRLYLMALPLTALAVILGHRLSRSIRPERFGRVVYAALIGLGLLLLI